MDVAVFHRRAAAAVACAAVAALSMFLLQPLTRLPLASAAACTNGPTNTWMGPNTGGPSGLWSTAGNWSKNAIPTSSDVVCIPTLATAYTVTLGGLAAPSGAAQSIEIDSTATLVLDANGGGATLSVGNVTNNGTLTLSSSGSQCYEPLLVFGAATDTLTNTGTLNLDDSCSTAGVPAEVEVGGITNSGAIDVLSGFATFFSSGAPTYTNTGAVTVSTGAQLKLDTNGTFDQNGGTITNTGTGQFLVEPGTFAFNGGTITSSGTPVTITGGDVSFGGSGTGTVAIVGTDTLVAGSSETIGPNQVLNLDPTPAGGPAVLIVPKGTSITNNGTMNLQGQPSGGSCGDYPELQFSAAADTLTNNGTLNFDDTCGSNAPALFTTGGFSNTSSGTINVTGLAELFVNGSAPTYTNAGSVTVNTGSQLQQAGGTFEQNTGGTITNTGTGQFLVDPGTFAFNDGTITSTGNPVTVTSGDVSFGGSGTGTVAIVGTDTLVAGSGETIGANQVLDLDPTLAGGTAVLIIPNGTSITNNGTVTLQGQPFGGSCGDYPELQFSAATDTLTNNGTLNFDDPCGSATDPALFFTGGFNNTSSGTINVTGFAELFASGNPAYTNSGLFDVHPASTLTFVNGAWDNKGTLRLEEPSGLLKATGGTFNPDTGTLEFDIAGAAPDLGTLDVPAIALSGTADPVLEGGFVPANGQEFPVINVVSSHSGAFTTVENGFTGDTSHALFVDLQDHVAVAANSSVAASPTTVTADGKASSTVTVTLKDSGDSPVSGKTVTLAGSAGTSSVVSAASGPSNSSGVVTFTVTDTTVEPVTYTATDVTDGFPLAAIVHFVVAGASASNSTVQASPTSVAADGVASSMVTVTLLDSNHAAVQNKTVTLTQGSSLSAISAASGPSNSSGVVTFTVTDRTAEVVTYTATDTTDSVTIAQMPIVTFTSAVASAATSTVTANPIAAPADGATTSTITVTLLDSNKVPVQNKTVTLAGNAGSSSVISPASGSSNGSGVVTFTVKDGNQEIVTYTATDTSDNVTVGSTASVDFTEPPANAAKSTVLPASQSVPADGATTATITVTLLDINSHAVVGRAVSLSQTGSSTISAPGTSNSSGFVTFTVKDSKAEIVTYTAHDSSDNVTITATAAVTFTAAVASAANSTVSANPTSAVADGKASSTITVTLLDSGSVPVAGKTVTLSQGSGHSAISAAGGPSNISGVVTFTVTDTTAEAVTYTATDTTDSVLITPSTATVTFTAAVASAGSSTVAASPTSVAADGKASSTITVTLLDSGGVPVAGKTVTLGQGSGHSVITTLQGTTDTSGVAKFTVADKTAETVTYTATDTTDSVQITETATVTFAAAVASAGSSTVAASPTSVAADGKASSTITVTLLDSGGVPVAGKTVTLGQGAGHSVISAASGPSGGNGVVTFTVTDTTAEAVTYTATDTTDGVLITPSTATVTFTAVAPPPCSNSPTRTWASPGTSGLWSTASAWTPSGTPGSSDNVCVPTSATPYSVTVQGAQSASTIQIDSGATLEIDANATTKAILTVGTGITNNGTLTLQWLAGSGTSCNFPELVFGGLTSSGASTGLKNAGTLNLGAGTRLCQQGDGGFGEAVVVGDGIANTGTISVPSGGTVFISDSSTVDSYTNSNLFDVGTFSSVSLRIGSTFDNTGTVRLREGSRLSDTTGRFDPDTGTIEFDIGNQCGFFGTCSPILDVQGQTIALSGTAKPVLEDGLTTSAGELFGVISGRHSGAFATVLNGWTGDYSYFDAVSLVAPGGAAVTPPSITTISPQSVRAGHAAFTLTVNESALDPASNVCWNGAPLATIGTPSATQAQATVPASDVATAGTAQVTVVDNTCGTAPSNALPFYITQTNATVTAENTGTGPTASATVGGTGPNARGSVTATLTGGSQSTTVTVARYSGNPGNPTTLGSGGSFYDVQLSSCSGTCSLKIVDCNGGNLEQWYNGSAWVSISPSSAVQLHTPAGCNTISLTGSTSPNVTQLGGTPFANGCDDRADHGDDGHSGQDNNDDQCRPSGGDGQGNNGDDCRSSGGDGQGNNGDDCRPSGGDGQGQH